MKLENKVIVVTGAGSGIGAASAKLMASSGARVIAVDIDLKKAEETVAEIKKLGGKATARQVDVTQFKEVEDLVKQVVKEYGSIDVMVNNAGIGGKNQNKTAEHTLEDWHNVIAVNQTGVFYCMKAALQQMMLQGVGNIINIASLAGLKPSGNNLSYSASKFAVVGMTKSAALEYGRKNIRINAVCPGYTHSSLLDQLLASRPDMVERLKQMIPMGRFGEATEVAETVAWLASDSSKYITGQTITIDGGTSLH
ncbi:SDR family NAD(P)-dependent oxidoreductase [Muriicola sp.]|uniref:SDR family NAD(P)-dependent oxidoreductase n=1 Tax=Muriicola sp. TaxID=2020856 RepID=UPI003C75F439